ncbi:MAG: hypothetical protein GY937_12360 [bacterium]|nr:hypothetical protein [bacterium]
MCAGVVLGIGFSALLSAASWGPRLFADSERKTALAVAMSGGRKGLLDLALERLQVDSADGMLLLRAEMETKSRAHHGAAYLATVLATRGRCNEASDALTTAELRATPNQREVCAWIQQAREHVSGCSDQTGARLGYRTRGETRTR